MSRFRPTRGISQDGNFGVMSGGTSQTNIPDQQVENPKTKKFLEKLVELVFIKIRDDTTRDDEFKIRDILATIDVKGEVSEIIDSAIQSYQRTRSRKIEKDDLIARLDEIIARVEYEPEDTPANLEANINIEQQVTGEVDAIFMLYISYFGPPSAVDTENTINGYDKDKLNQLLDVFKEIGSDEYSNYIQALGNIISAGNVVNPSNDTFRFIIEGVNLEISGNKYKTLLEADASARFKNIERTYYPFKFPYGGKIEFTAYIDDNTVVNLGDASINLYFKFDYNDTVGSNQNGPFNTAQITVDGSASTKYSLDIQSQSQDSEYSVFYMYVLTRDIFVNVDKISIIEYSDALINDDGIRNVTRTVGYIYS
jgi:hypothetical protein